MFQNLSSTTDRCDEGEGVKPFRPRNRVRWTRLLGVSLAVIVVTIAGGAGNVRVLFSDAFDDDAVGSVPENLPGSVWIDSEIGYVVGLTTHPAGAIKVGPAIGDSMVGNILRMSDAGIPEGAGHTEVSAIPVVPAGPGSVRTTFRLRCGKFYGDTFEMAVIDNRATPGTGRLAVVAIDSAGVLWLGDKKTGTNIYPGVTYTFSVEVQLDPDGPDTWTMRLQDESSPNTAESWGPFASEADGTEVSSVEFSTADVGTGSYDLDELAIIVQ